MRLFDFTLDEIADCYITAWLHEPMDGGEGSSRSYPGVIICPGGGYYLVSSIEAEPVAEQYFAAGYNTFLLHYSVRDQAKDFIPLLQLAHTVARIRRCANEWDTDPNRIAVCGFSAGGHLACSLGTLFNDPVFLGVLGKTIHIRPDAMILCYPVITADNSAHVGSIEMVSGARKNSEKYQWFGLDLHVDKETPPTFLWHTAEDPGVPVENSLKMASALSSAKVPFELHIFPYGGHGMSVCTKRVDNDCSYNRKWIALSIEWLNMQFNYQM